VSELTSIITQRYLCMHDVSVVLAELVREF
jgi:hypothetical protein